MTDEQLIERIRSELNDEVAGVHPPADLLERLRSAPSPRHRSPSGVGGALAMVLSVVTVGLVALAIATVGQRSSSSSTASPVAAAVPSLARELVARMAVLRRPQNPADRLPASVMAQEARSPGGFRVLPGLTRLAATVDAGPGPLGAVAIYVVVGRPPGYPADIVTALEVAGPPGHRYLLYPANVVDTGTAAANGGVTPSAVSFNAGPTGKAWLDVGVVPDGVTRVTWVYRERGAPAVPVHPEIKNNVAVPEAGTLTGQLDATWYGPDGRVIASYDEAAARQAAAARALASSARQPIAPALIEHFAVFRRRVPPPARIKQLPYRTAVLVARQGFGLNVTQARFVPYPGSPPLWVIPGASGVSMVRLTARGGGGNNVPVSVALSGGMITLTCCGSGNVVWGLVPDGNRTVTAVLADGHRKTVRVIDNVYSVTGRVTAIVAKDAAGLRTVINAP